MSFLLIECEGGIVIVANIIAPFMALLFSDGSRGLFRVLYFFEVVLVILYC